MLQPNLTNMTPNALVIAAIKNTAYVSTRCHILESLFCIAPSSPVLHDAETGRRDTAPAQ